ncbi:LrgB family protein, partial [Akkermansia muciniphila]|uniref:LrgB family protein n=1 Tax=Akkermansia muciniphila TaxID=239935 RepID=UPI00122F7EA7
MKDFLVSSVFFGVFMSLVGYEVGGFLKRKLKLAIFNPLLISILFVIGALLLLPVDYAAYNESAQTLSYFITPATICLAIPLYLQFALLKKHWKAIIGGVVAGVLSS